MIRHFVKIFYGNFMDTLEREVNEYLSKSDFSTVAEIQDIKISPRDHGGHAIMVHYKAHMEVR